MDRPDVGKIGNDKEAIYKLSLYATSLEIKISRLISAVKQAYCTGPITDKEIDDLLERIL